MILYTYRWLDGGDEHGLQHLVRIGPDGALVATTPLGVRQDGGEQWFERPTLVLAGAEPLQVLVSGSYTSGSDSDSVTARKLRRHVFLDARANEYSADPTCLVPIGEPLLDRSNSFDEIEGGKVLNLGSTGDEAWGLKATAKQAGPTCWRIDERWRSPAGVRAAAWGFVRCWDAASGSLQVRCDPAPYPPPRQPYGAAGSGDPGQAGRVVAPAPPPREDAQSPHDEASRP